MMFYVFFFLSVMNDDMGGARPLLFVMVVISSREQLYHMHGKKWLWDALSGLTLHKNRHQICQRWYINITFV